MRKWIGIIGITFLFSTVVSAQRSDGDCDDYDDDGPVQVGWAVVTPLAVTTSGASSGLVVFATFGKKHGDEMLQASVLPASLTTNAMMFVSADGKLSRNVGVGIINPNGAAANSTMTLRDQNGHVLGTPKNFTLSARSQTAQFITSLFSDRPEIPKDFDGTLKVTSDLPVSIIGLRFRGENFSSIPVTNLATTNAVPEVRAGIGGSGSIIVPEVAAGGGWASELILVNTGTDLLTVRVDFFKQDGTDLSIRLNGQSKNSFTNLVIPAGGVFELAPRSKDGHDRF